MKQVALIGVSGYGTIYRRLFAVSAKQGKMKLAAAVIRNPDKVRDVYEELVADGTAIFPSEEAMYAQFAGKLDLVGIPTGIEFHERMMANALAHGANVLIEKPIAGSLAEADRMIETARRADGRFVAVGFQHAYATELQMFQRRLQGGEFGKIRRITAFGLWPRNDTYYHRNNWAGKKFAADGTPIWDSPINNAFAHYLNIALFLCADQPGGAASGKLQRADLLRARQAIETFDLCRVELEANGAAIRCFFSHADCENFDPVIRVECENGMIDWGADKQWQIRSNSGELLESAAIAEPHQRMVDLVLEHLDNPAAFIYSLEAARNHTAVIEALKAVPVTDVAPELVWQRRSDGQLAVDSVAAQVASEWRIIANRETIS